MPWLLAATAVGGIASAVQGNAARHAANDAAAQAAANAPQLNPAQIGQASLNAQGQLAPQVLSLESLYGPQFSNTGNANLNAGLFGASGALQTNQQDPNFSKLPQDIQQLLASNPSLVSSIQGKNPFDQMTAIYQATGKPLTTAADAEAFNEWSSNKFGNWHETGTAPGLEALTAWSSSKQPGGAAAPAPGLIDIIGKANQQLNPGLQSGLDKINAAAGNTPVQITAPTISPGQSTAVLQGILGANVPQVSGVQANAGQDALTKLLGGNGGATQINASQVATPIGANLAGPAQQATLPTLAAASQATAQGSAAPITVNAPGAVANIQGQSVAGPTGYDKVATPSAVGNIGGPGPIDNIVLPMPVGNVNAQTGYDKVTAPGAVANVQAPSGVANIQAPGAVQVGKNTALDSIGQFSANRPIQQTLEQQALSDLSLGNQMNADQVRAAQQAARAAANARGGVAGNPAILQEVQRQFNVSNQLQNERRGFAAAVENQGFGQQATAAGINQGTAGLGNQYLGLGLQAGLGNAANQLSAAQANQQAGLTTQGQGLQAGLANQQAALNTAGMGLQAGIANQNAGLAGNQLNLQGQLANQSTGLANNAQNLQAQGQNQQNAQFLANLGFQTGAQNQQTGLANNAQALQAGIANQNAGLNFAGLGLQAGIANQNNAFNVGAQNQQSQLTQGAQALQANLANASNLLQNNQFNAGLNTQNNQFNAGQANQQQLAMAQLMAQLGISNAGQANQMAQFNAGQQDSARNAFLQAGTTNAQLMQQANLANQGAGLQGFQNQANAAQALGALGNQTSGLNQNAQQANQGAFLQNQGQNINALQALAGQENQIGMFNAGNNLQAQQFNAGQTQLGFQNLLAAGQANQAAALNPLSLVGLNQQNAQPQYFNPFDPAIMAMYAGNQANAANAGMAAGNNAAALGAAQQQAFAQLLGSGVNAYGQYSGAQGPNYNVSVGPFQPYNPG